MRRLRGVVLLTLVFAIVVAAQEAKRLTPAEAKDHIGQEATVCGKIASATLTARSKGQPTFVNLKMEKPYPTTFAILIWGTDRGKFDPSPEVKFRDKRVCVTGRIRDFRGAPEIVVSEPKQIRVEAEQS